MKTKKSRILLSAVSVLLVFSLLVGGTMAWFTDTEKVDANFTAGILDIEVNPDPDYTTKEPLKFENLRPMQYANFYKELEPEIAFGNELDNNVAANGMQDSDYKPVPVYFKPVQIENRGTLPTKVDISVNLGKACDDGEENIKLINNDKTVDWDGTKNGDCTNGLQKVLKIFVYKNVDGVWERMEDVNLNKLYDETVADPDKTANDNTALETKNVYTTAMIPAGDDATYVIAGYLPETVGNTYQGKHYHADLMFNAYQVDDGASSGGSSSEDPDPTDVQIIIHYTLADGTKIGEDYKINAKSDAFPYTVTEELAAPGLPKGYHFTDPEQSYESTLTGDTASDVTFIVEKDEEPVEPAEITFTLYDVFNEENVANVPAVKITETTTFDKNNTELYLPEGYVLYPDTQSQTITFTGGKADQTTVTFNVYKKSGDRIVITTQNGLANVLYGLDGVGGLGNTGNGMKGNYELGKNISMTSANWMPIGMTSPSNVGTGNYSFSGEFDGKNYSVNGLNVDRVTANASVTPAQTAYRMMGLFSSNVGTIKNVNLSNVYVRGNHTIGAVVGINRGTVENCHVLSGTVVGAHPLAALQYGGNTGGVVGENSTNGLVKGCSSAVSVKAYTHSGALVGKNFGTIQESYTTAKTGSTIGGGVNDSLILNTQVSYAYLGSLVGSNQSGGVIENCYTHIYDQVNGFVSVGGFIGYNAGTVRSCWSYVENGIKYKEGPAHVCIGSYSTIDNPVASNVYFLAQSAQSVNQKGEHVSESTLKSATPLPNFDTSVWNFVAGEYPDLKSNPRA